MEHAVREGKLYIPHQPCDLFFRKKKKKRKPFSSAALTMKRCINIHTDPNKGKCTTDAHLTPSDKGKVTGEAGFLLFLPGFMI